MVADFWKDQYKRVLRHRKYILDLLAIKNEIDPELHDAYINFFIHCYSLKDWLKHNSFSDVEVYCNNNNTYLQICSGIANGSKHFKLTSERYENQYYRQFISTNTSLLRYSSTGNSPSDNISSNIHPKACFKSGDYIIESSIIPSITAYDLMNSCIDAWNSYLIEKGIDIKNI